MQRGRQWRRRRHLLPRSGQEAEQVAPRKQGRLVPALHCPRFIFLVLGFFLRCLGGELFLPSHHHDSDAGILFQEPVPIHQIVCGSNGFTVLEANKRSNLDRDVAAGD